jgi:hypothetical protein
MIQRAWVLSATGLMLRSQGRLEEAIDAHQRGLTLEERLASQSHTAEILINLSASGVSRAGFEKLWLNPALSASSLSEVLLIAGNISEAVRFGELAVLYARRARSSAYEIIHLTTLADALAAKGSVEEAAAKFEEAERVRGKPLESLQGYHHRDFLLGAR